MDAAALVAGDSYKQIALLPRRALFEGTQKLNQTVRAALRSRFFKLQDYEADLACEALERTAGASLSTLFLPPFRFASVFHDQLCSFSVLLEADV